MIVIWNKTETKTLRLVFIEIMICVDQDHQLSTIIASIVNNYCQIEIIELNEIESLGLQEVVVLVTKELFFNQWEKRFHFLLANKKRALWPSQ